MASSRSLAENIQQCRKELLRSLDHIEKEKHDFELLLQQERPAIQKQRLRQLVDQLEKMEKDTQDDLQDVYNIIKEVAKMRGPRLAASILLPQSGTSRGMKRRRDDPQANYSKKKRCN